MTACVYSYLTGVQMDYFSLHIGFAYDTYHTYFHDLILVCLAMTRHLALILSDEVTQVHMNAQIM